MAYQIEYDMQTIRVIKRNRKNELLSGIMLAVFLTVSAICGHFGGMVLESFLSRRSAAHTAAEQLVEDLQSGEKLQDAVASFCAELIP